MALEELNFEFKADNPVDFPREWLHYGVVGSGDLEVLMERADLNGAVKVKVVTPVKGFAKVWERVLAKTLAESRIGNVSVEINDNNATPIVVTMRLRQALAGIGKNPDGGAK